MSKNQQEPMMQCKSFSLVALLLCCCRLMQDVALCCAFVVCCVRRPEANAADADEDVEDADEAT
jgi:hypothetical protein